VDLYGTGKATALGGTTTTRPVSSRTSGARPPTGPETPEQKVARLEAENAALRAERTKLATEREILRQAAKYFAGETNW
jgi:transposase